MKNLILVIGSEGMVGSRFVEISQRKNFLHLPKQVELDITNKSEIKAILSSYNFSAVVNFAAFTDVSGAENQRGDKKGDCWQINVEGIRNLVEAIRPFKEKIHFIHISTDMVFPGSEENPGPYSEDDAPDENSSKVTWYGYTKAEGERVIKEALGVSATILRIIYPVRAKFEPKADYIRKPLQLYDQGKLYPLFSDQQVSISYIDDVSRVIDKIIIDNLKGVFHAGSDNTTTPHELITYVLEKARNLKKPISSTTLEEFIRSSGSSPIRYPKFGGLKVRKTEEKLGMKFGSWQKIVSSLLAQGLGE